MIMQTFMSFRWLKKFRPPLLVVFVLFWSNCFLKLKDWRWVAGLNLASLELWISARHNLRGGEFFLNTFYQSLDYEDNAPEVISTLWKPSWRRSWARASVTYCESGVGRELMRKRGKKEVDHLSSYFIQYPPFNTQTHTAPGMGPSLSSATIYMYLSKMRYPSGFGNIPNLIYAATNQKEGFNFKMQSDI